MPWIETADIPACQGWAEFEILASTVFAELKRGGVIGNAGDSRHLLESYRRLRQAQLSFARELGMTPAARLAIKASGTNAALDLVAAMNAPADDAEEVK